MFPDARRLGTRRGGTHDGEDARAHGLSCGSTGW